MPPGRGQSDTVGVLAVLVLVVALVVTLGSGLLAGIDTSSKPLLDAEFAADGTDVTITHRGGDSIDASALSVVLRDGRGNVTRFSVASASMTGDADGRFDPGESATHGHGFSSVVVEVLIVHEPTGAALVDETVDVESSGGGGSVTNDVPSATVDVSPGSPEVGQPVTFDASGSTDPDGTITAYEWDFDGDGSIDETGATASHTSLTPGTHTVTLRVTDDDGATDAVNETVTVEVSAPNTDPVAAFTYERDGFIWGPVDLDATASTDADGTIDSYEWDLDGDGVYEESGKTVVDAYIPFGTRVTLRVTDDDGARVTVTRLILW